MSLRLGKIAILLGLSLEAFMLFQLSLTMGANLEEVAGLSRVRIEWVVPRGEALPDETGGALQYSRELPVWGIERDGAFTPLMIDGHVGAVSFYPARLAYSAGGLTAARALHAGLGMLALCCAALICKRLFGPHAGLLTLVFLATSPLFVLLHIGARADEQWSFLCPLLGVLALLLRADTGRSRWLFLAAFLFGLGAAAKNTAVWTAFAALAATLSFGFRPRSWKETAVAGLSFVVPLLPQAAYLLSTPSAAPFTSRLDMVPRPWRAFTLDRIEFFGRHFIDSIAGFGSRFGTMFDGSAGSGSSMTSAAGLLLLAAAVASGGMALRRSLPAEARAFGLGFLLLLLQYVGFYYAGGSFFILLLPWFAIAASGLAVSARDLAKAARSNITRTAVKSFLAAAVTLVIANQGIELERFCEAVSSPAFSIFNLDTQKRLAAALEELGIEKPWTTTYAIAGVLETLSEGKMRPRHAFPIFRDACRRNRDPQQAYQAAWAAVFNRMGPGAHHVVLSPNPNDLEASPCRQAGLIAETFPAAAEAKGVSWKTLRTIEAWPGRPLFSVAEVTF